MKKISLYITCILAWALSACESIDVVPKTSGNSEAWYTQEIELEMAVREFYLLGYWIQPLESTEQWSDNFTYRNQNRNPGSGGTVLDGTLNGQQWEVYNLWQQSYKLIARANSLLENIHKAEGNVSAEKIARYAGEAYFCRACKYGDLCFFYGDVPYVKETQTISESLAQGRRSRDEIIPLIYDDFDKAIEGLPISYDSGQEHFTKGAALAMKARYALYFGDYEIAADAAKKCMKLGIYSLEPEFADIFWQSTKQIPEKIFSIPRSIVDNVILDSWFVNNGLPRNAGGYAADTPSWDLLAAFLCTDGLPIDQSPLFDPRNPFKNRDPRCTKTIVEFNTAHCGFEYDPSPAASKVMNYSTGALQTNNDSRINNQYASFNGLIWKKGIDSSWTENGKNVETDWIMVRYADVLLMYAEAMIEQDKIDNSVVDAINQVRARAYGVSYAATSLYPAVTMGDQAAMRKILRIERRMELAKENLRYQDLIRWRLAEKALNSYNYINLQPDDCLNKVVNKGLWFWAVTPVIDEDGLPDFSALYNGGYCALGAKRVFPARQYLWPIPTHDQEICSNLGNNPGY